jgi:hypothetical protein
MIQNVDGFLTSLWDKEKHFLKQGWGLHSSALGITQKGHKSVRDLINIFFFQY